MRLQSSVGRALAAVIRGDTTMLEHMRLDNMLDNFYEHSLGLPSSNRYPGRLVKQPAHRYPQMSFIEIGQSIHKVENKPKKNLLVIKLLTPIYIGAGTGSSTKAAFEALGGAYSSYTYTDISSGFWRTLPPNLWNSVSRSFSKHWT
jgi:hybrid polyketide synthase / nonribosomal peptide synthetase ACE1